MVALDTALANICRLLVVTIPLIQFGRNAPCKFWGGRDHYFWRTGVRKGSAMVLLGRALISSYRLPMLTTPLTEAVWLQFAMQVFEGAVSTPFGRIGDCMGFDLVPHTTG